MEVKTKMNEKLIKPGVVKRIADSLRHKDKNYTQEDIETILSAFWDVVINSFSFKFELANVIHPPFWQ